MKNILYIFIATLLFTACTDGWEDLNENPLQLTESDLTIDYNNIGSFYSSMFYQIFAHQTSENLVSEEYSMHLSTPTIFNGGLNNTTYYITYNNDYWGGIYSRIMSPAEQVKLIAKEAGNYPVFVQWANLVKVMGMSKLTTYYGPLIYSQYGGTGEYDSEEDLYGYFFEDLDSVQAVFEVNEDYEGLTNFDKIYGGDMLKWQKFVNSLRLRLAIRVSNVAPELAKTEGQKAINHSAGLITSADDDCYIFLNGNEIYTTIISNDWGDTRMSAAMESFLVGFKDPRISKFFDETTYDAAMYADHPDYPYKGVLNGAYKTAKTDHTDCSAVSTDLESWTRRPYLTSSEVYFDLAEAALRGWSGAGDARENYEKGIAASFTQWGASGAEAYIADNTNTPIDYVDLFYENITYNNFEATTDITVAWDEGASNETKLEKIITQKWIASFSNPNEPWADFRRTGYPKLPHIYDNQSVSTWGVVADDEWIRRMTFAVSQRNNNAEGIAAAAATMKGDDLITTRLWFDTGGSNF
ncbi:SusD/RagB family nutrient-binding outer membrane lipoprotein [Maribellus maritimus]|uniref:SusD/RagB family nutrient-binding outer membrane lipoprotein n=1 Tax=Maribellus maritimus TaxID=2870838 RepID=UPI001EEB4883|nr:SusD/RagB family nutrient-binding outer membrane lipoprotein [Maribellus maritimus]MCG6190055.1 SusD/RagB family nutrient-binding outer membrane lipoprotein [Maribellus maritimus]